MNRIYENQKKEQLRKRRARFAPDTKVGKSKENRNLSKSRESRERKVSKGIGCVVEHLLLKQI